MMLADWEGISPARNSATLNVLRADPVHPLDFRIGRDARGRFVFQLDAAGVLSEADGIESPAGVEVILDDIGDGIGRLTLLLNDREDFAIFRVLCGDLLEVTRTFVPSEASRAVSMLLGRLRQWQEVLARRRRGRLSRNEEMGLFGELLFLRDILWPRLGIASAVNAWRGPYGDEQDFVVAGRIIEVKTQSSTSDSWIFVSSEDQLDTSSIAIFLCRQCVAASDSGAPGKSLDGIVADLIAATAHPSAANVRLRTALEAAGWVQGVGYDEYWRLDERSFYEVRDGFPRIVRADLPSGVARVRYQIALADCLPFRVEEAALYAGGTP